MVGRFLPACLACLLAQFAPLPTSQAQDSIATLETVVELPSETPFEQEMLLLRIQGTYTAPITLQSLEQPDLRNFGWMQLGRDRWFEDMLNGRKVLRFERSMAVFPQRGGNLTIGPFVHRQTILNARGAREQIEVVSEPVSVEVRPKPANMGWWLPARSLAITDQWERPPDRLGPGEVARRTVILEAEGIGPELFPPIPSLRTPDIVAFFDPEERSTILTPEGPVSKVTWRWSIKGKTSTPATLPEVTIPWFDTRTREMRELKLGAREVSLASVAAEGSLSRRAWSGIWPLAMLAGFVGGLALAMRRSRLRSRAEFARLIGRFLPDRRVVALRRAARSGDVRSTWRAANRIVREHGSRQAPARELRGLDEAVFGRPAARPKVNLRHVVREVLGLLRLHAGDRQASSSSRITR